MKAPRPLRFIDGYSESAWKSLVVKSLRIGWVAGLEEANTRLAPSTMQSLLICGVFEDIFPTAEELPAVMDEIRGLDFDALCARNTHHARGYTADFCAMEHEAVSAAQTRKRDLWDEARRLKMWLPDRALNCFYTWLKIWPKDASRRPIDKTPWRGMPTVMLDGHTFEGKKAGVIVALLSGHYHNHLELSRKVAAGGWDAVRKEAHGIGITEGKKVAQQNTLF